MTLSPKTPRKALRKSWIKRGKPVARTPMRKGKPKSAKEVARTDGPRAFRIWLKAQPCLIAGKHQCSGLIEAAHLLKDDQSGTGRKAGWRMQGPLCGGAHRLAHSIGHKSFQVAFSVDFAAAVQRIQAAWRVVCGESE